MNGRKRETTELIRDMQSIFVRNPSDMTWRKIGKTLFDKGWRKKYADSEEYKVTEDDVRTAFLVLTNFADEIVDIAEKKQPFVDKVCFALTHLKIYELQEEFEKINSEGYCNSIWKKYEKKSD